MEAGEIQTDTYIAIDINKCLDQCDAITKHCRGMFHSLYMKDTRRHCGHQ